MNPAERGLTAAEPQVVLQDGKGKPLRLASKPQLKRLQGNEVDAENGAGVQLERAGATLTPEQEDAAIEQDLVKMKEERLKRIQALPSTVWT